MNAENKKNLNVAIAATGKKKCEIADELKIPRATFYCLLAGHVMPGPRGKLAKYLGESVSDLFGGYK